MTVLRDQYLGVHALTKNYSLTEFVETGCYQGEGLDHAQRLGYSNLYSCDIDLARVTECQITFPTAVIVHQESVVFLEHILPRVHGAALFWLDAHYPADYGQEETTATKFPIIEEILRIKQYKTDYQRDVIIIDDIRVFDSQDNPFVNRSIGEYYMMDLSIQQITDLLSDTHDYQLVQADTGNLIFTPRA